MRTFTINNSAGVTISSPMTAGALNLTRGQLRLGANNLTVGGINGGNATSYIRTDGAGRVIIAMPNGGTRFIPAGNSAFNPASITHNSGTTDVFSVLVLDEVYQNGADGAAFSSLRVRRTWDISKTNPNGGSGISLTLNWNPCEAESITVPRLYHFENGACKKQTGTTSAGTNSITYTGYTGSFSPFAVGDDLITLPVSWLSFTATARQGAVNLAWQTAAELNARSYAIEHSRDGHTWTGRGTVAAAGNTTTARQYTFLDAAPETGINYYRLLQTDKDGNASYSKVVTIRMAAARSTIAFYPNPVLHRQLTILLDKATTVQVFNASGVMGLQQQCAPGTQQLNLKHLAKGAYTLKAADAIQQFMVQ